jgi:thymidine phosphorylase
MDDMERTRVMKELTHERVEAGFEMHQSLAQICRTQSQPAKRVEKMLEQQFAPYKNEVERLDAQKISAIIEGSTENTLTNVPIPALIWFAVRNGGQDKELETRICCIGMVIYFILLIYTIFLSRFMIPSLFFS